MVRSVLKNSRPCPGSTRRVSRPIRPLLHAQRRPALQPRPRHAAPRPPPRPTHHLEAPCPSTRQCPLQAPVDGTRAPSVAGLPPASSITCANRIRLRPCRLARKTPSPTPSRATPSRATYTALTSPAPVKCVQRSSSALPSTGSKKRRPHPPPAPLPPPSRPPTHQMLSSLAERIYSDKTRIRLGRDSDVTRMRSRLGPEGVGHAGALELVHPLEHVLREEARERRREGVSERVKEGGRKGGREKERERASEIEIEIER